MTQTLSKPWAIFFLVESGKRQCLSRFTSRSEAETVLGLLKRQIPDLKPEVVFDNQQL